jgi:hypothetical protein
MTGDWWHRTGPSSHGGAVGDGRAAWVGRPPSSQRARARASRPRGAGSDRHKPVHPFGPVQYQGHGDPPAQRDPGQVRGGGAAGPSGPRRRRPSARSSTAWGLGRAARASVVDRDHPSLSAADRSACPSPTNPGRGRPATPAGHPTRATRNTTGCHSRRSRTPRHPAHAQTAQQTREPAVPRCGTSPGTKKTGPVGASIVSRLARLEVLAGGWAGRHESGPFPGSRHCTPLALCPCAGNCPAWGGLLVCPGLGRCRGGPASRCRSRQGCGGGRRVCPCRCGCYPRGRYRLAAPHRNAASRDQPPPGTG